MGFPVKSTWNAGEGIYRKKTKFQPNRNNWMHFYTPESGDITIPLIG